MTKPSCYSGGVPFQVTVLPMSSEIWAIARSSCAGLGCGVRGLLFSRRLRGVDGRVEHLVRLLCSVPSERVDWVGVWVGRTRRPAGIP